MSDSFKALQVNKTDDGQTVAVVQLTEADLMDGDVTIDVSHSTINYKDGLALTGKVPVVRKFPLIPGIDFAGTVRSSDHRDFKPGDHVVLNGWGVGESHHGGYAERARVPGDWLVPLPESIDAAHAMAIGTAGYTAMLCVMALEDQGVKPDDGDILVTGAAGGVGSVAIALLSKLGYSVTASTGRLSEADFLRGLGANNVVERNEFSDKPRPLGKMRWAGAVDAVGSNTLANVISQINYGGTVAACGLAQGMDLPTSVAPFILRGVKLIGVDSVMCPKLRRVKAWQRLADDLDMAKLDSLTNHAGFNDIERLGAEILAGQVRGRMVIKI